MVGNVSKFDLYANSDIEKSLREDSKTDAKPDQNKNKE